MVTPSSPPTTPSAARRPGRRTAVGLVLMLIGSILALIGPASSPASALTHDGLTSIGTDTVPNLDTYPEGLFPAGCGVTDGQVVTGAQYSASGPVTAGPVSDMRDLPYLPAGTTLTMTFTGWVEGCETPISLTVKRAVGPDFDELTDQALLAFEACGPEAAGDLPACETVGEGLRTLSLVMPQAGSNCNYQTDAVVGPPLDIVGPDGSYYGSGLRASNGKGEGPTMLISADNEGPDDADGSSCQPPTVTLQCAEGGVAVTIFNNDVFDDIRVTIVADDVDQAVDFEVLRNSSRTFVVPLTGNAHPILEVFDAQREILAPTPFADVCVQDFAIERLCQDGEILVTVTAAEGADIVVLADGVEVGLDENDEYRTPIGDVAVTIEVVVDEVSLGTQTIQPCGVPTAEAVVDCAADTVTVTTTQPVDHTVTFAVTVNGAVVTNPVAVDQLTSTYTYQLTGLEPFGDVDVLVTATHNGVTTTLIDDTLEPCDAPTFTFGTLSPTCENDVPYLVYSATVTGTTDTTLDLHWLDAQGTERLVMTDLPLSGEVLWPGAAVDSQGNPTDWPGWVFENGDWVEKDDGFTWARTASVFAVVNPTSATVALTYPPPTPTCDANPDPTEVLGVTQAQAQLPTTGSDAGGQLALALGLVVTGFGLVLLGHDQRLRLLLRRR